MSKVNSTDTKNVMSWTRKGNGYYTATGFSGIGVSIIQDATGWHVHAGDNTAVRATAATLRDAKIKAERLFG